MTYSACDFEDSITDALGIHEKTDDQSALANMALDEIERLQKIEEAARMAVVDGVCKLTKLQLLIDALARPKMELPDDDDDDDDDDESRAIGERGICSNCHLEIEWNGEAWHDRGGNENCAIAYQKPGAVQPHTVDSEEEQAG